MIFHLRSSLMSAYVVITIILKNTHCFTKKKLFLVAFMYENAVKNKMHVLALNNRI